MTRLDKVLTEALPWPLGFVGAASIIDGLLTQSGIERGTIVEANPLWAQLLATSPALFWVLKLLLTFGSIFILLWYGQRYPRIAFLGASLSAAVYVVILWIHFMGLLGILTV